MKFSMLRHGSSICAGRQLDYMRTEGLATLSFPTQNNDNPGQWCDDNNVTSNFRSWNRRGWKKIHIT